MRLKEDNSNWKSGGIIRRDFRHSHSEPEIPKASKKKPVGSKSLCPKRDDGHHDPVAIVERRCHLRDRDVEGVTYKVYEEHLVIRCASCKTTDLSPALLAPFFDLLSTKERSEVLAEHWCKKGHLYEEGEVSSSAYSLAFRLRRPMETCAMCGRRKSNAWNPAPIKDANLLAGAGVPEKAAALVITGRAGNPRERIIEERVD